MSNRFLAYEIKGGEIESMDSQGRILSQKGNFISISTKAALKQLVMKTPERIFLKPLPNPYSDERPYQGFLVSAPKDDRYVIEGRKEVPQATNSLGRMMQIEYGREVASYFASIEWSEKLKKWRITS